MQKQQVKEIIRDILSRLRGKNAAIKSFDESTDEGTLISDLGIDQVTFSDLGDELERRLEGRSLDLNGYLAPEAFNTLTVREFLRHIHSKLGFRSRAPIVVYVDDEEENLFIFKRRYDKRLNLRTFLDPLEALKFIISEPDVALVITDQVMPKLSGNELCDEVQKLKPAVKFILVTGNPNNDEDLMYKSLRKNRFYEFINKPVDFDRKGEEYFNLITGLLYFDW